MILFSYFGSITGYENNRRQIATDDMFELKKKDYFDERV